MARDQPGHDEEDGDGEAGVDEAGNPGVPDKKNAGATPRLKTTSPHPIQLAKKLQVVLADTGGTI